MEIVTPLCRLIYDRYSITKMVLILTLCCLLQINLSLYYQQEYYMHQ